MKKAIAISLMIFVSSISALAIQVIRNLEYSISPNGVTIFIQVEQARSVQVKAIQSTGRIDFDLKGVTGPDLNLPIAGSNLISSVQMSGYGPSSVKLSLTLLRPTDYRVERKGGYVKLDLFPAIHKVKPTESASPAKPAKPSVVSQPPRGKPPQPKPENLISMDVRDVDLRDLLRALAKQAGVNVIMDESVQGKVSVILKKVTPLEAIKEVLASAGYFFERGEGYIRPTKTVKPELIKLKHADASALKTILSPLASSPDRIQADPNTNSILLSGSPDEIERLKGLIEKLDVAPENKVLKLFKLSNASAKGMVQVVSGFLSESGKVVADEATNSIAVLDKPEVMSAVEELIRRIDNMAPAPEKPESERLTTEVFRLKYVDAASLIDTIKDVLSSEGKVQAFYPQRSMITPLERESRGGIRYVRTGVSSTTGTKAETGERMKWSDTLIVTDTPQVIDKVREVIRKLDVKPQQVLIEARIVEISLDKTDELGIQWQAYHPESKSLVKFSPSKVSLSSGVQLGMISTKLLDQIMGMIQVLETEGKARILATPRTTTLNNELAQIIVSDRIPITTVYASERFTTTSYEYLDVGINLTVIPHISDDGYVILEVNPRIDSIKGTITGTTPPVISSRVAHTRVAVKDGETLVIGGLMKEERSENSSHVPVIGKLPLFGWIFSSKESTRHKTDLMVFITPKILK
ncbi:hypothetical protein J7M22_09825 [Candidatus Poribacteria bacterium]|nr:hypothetical protein [Candidatus Poribacteria bacterium]